MKIILSRKGFDSTTKEVDGVKIKVSGGKPSVFVPGGEMVSFPIPEIPEKHESIDPDLIGYDDIYAEGMSLRERMKALYGGDFASKWEHCHYDPDLQRGAFLGKAADRKRFCREGALVSATCSSSSAGFGRQSGMAAFCTFIRPSGMFMPCSAFCKLGKFCPPKPPRKNTRICGTIRI